MNKFFYDKQWNQIIIEIVNPIFKREGYTKSGQNYNKKCSDFWLSFNYQSNELSNSKMYTFNLGVCYPLSYELCYDKSFPKVPKPWYSIDYKRIGFLFIGSDYWYVINDKTDLDQLSEEIKVHINQYAIPYLERYKSLNDVINILKDEKRFDDLQYVSLLILNGYNNEGVMELKKLYRKYAEDKNEFWRNKCENIAKKLEVKLDLG